MDNKLVYKGYRSTSIVSENTTYIHSHR